MSHHIRLSVDDEVAAMLTTLCKASRLGQAALIRHLIVALHNETIPTIAPEYACSIVATTSKQIYWQRRVDSIGRAICANCGVGSAERMLILDDDDAWRCEEHSTKQQALREIVAHAEGGPSS